MMCCRCSRRCPHCGRPYARPAPWEYRPWDPFGRPYWDPYRDPYLSARAFIAGR